MTGRSGPLQGLRVVELGGIGPGPFAGMMLADLGAEVVRIDRPSFTPAPEDPLNRGKRSLVVDLKRPEGVDVVLRAVVRADALIEGFRPGVTERLGVGPDTCLALNPRLVYGRISAFGQNGPFAQVPAHDVNCLALAGVLAHVGVASGPPVIPLNIIGDFGGGGLLLAFGVVAAMVDVAHTGQGQVVDAAMLDGLTLLMAQTFAMLQQGTWSAERGTNALDGGAPFYNAYQTLDGGYVSVGAMEPKFFASLLELSGFSSGHDIDAHVTAQHDRARWPEVTERLRSLFATRTRAEWEALADQHETCFAPVLEMAEVPAHPHLVARAGFHEVGGITQPAPAPRFSRTPGAVVSGAPVTGADTRSVLAECGFDADEIQGLVTADVVFDVARPGRGEGR